MYTRNQILQIQTADKKVTVNKVNNKYELIIVALRNEKGSYNATPLLTAASNIVALRNEKGSYNAWKRAIILQRIVALRNEKGSYNPGGGR